jgi:topoisomerase-4 subunit A
MNDEDTLTLEALPTPADQLVLHTYSEDAYLDYAVAVVKGRALAQVEDGKKPVQRRILYAMNKLGLTNDVRPRKSASVVGEVMGKLHPHGDQSIYDAMVRMAQDFTLRYPLVTKQGNFGSRDGDPAAAMRYTEARLSSIADLLLSEIDMGTVDFKLNYDGMHQEPELLPARLPFLLLNGTSGIAVGMASEIPSHNLREVAQGAIAMVERPDITTAELLDIIPGPDFPGGAQLISSRADVLAVYEGGRGPLRMRARWRREDLARGQYTLVVDELPYQVSSKTIMEQLDALTNPQPPKDKKVITQQQANLKQIALDMLEKVIDESGKEAEIRLVLTPRTSKVDPDALMNFLFANTSLEETFSVNMTHIGLDGRPRTRGIREILSEWATFRFTTVTRRTNFMLDKTLARIHILEGRLTVFLNLDAVIKVVRDAEEPKTELMSTFGLSEVQSLDILEMRLRQLNKLEGIKLEKERDELRAEEKRLRALLENPKAMRKLIVTEITSDAAKHGDDRRTLIKESARAAAATAIARSVADDDVTIIVSKNLWVRSRSGHDLDESTLTYKGGDERFAVIKTRTLNAVVFLDSKGRSYSVQASDIPASRGDGVPLTTLIDIQDGARILHALSGVPEQTFLFAGQGGCGFVAPLKSLVATRKAGKSFLTVAAGETPMEPVRLPANTPGFVILGSGNGRLLAFAASEVKTLANGGQGVQLMVLEDGEQLSGIGFAVEAPVSLVVEGSGAPEIVLQGDEWQKYVVRRARKGYLLPKKAVMRRLT